MKRIFLIPVVLMMMMATACGDTQTATDNGDTTETQSSETLSLDEGQFYIIQATGAITDTFVGESWGDEWQTRRLFEDGAQDEYWTLRLGGNNGVDDTAVSLIHLAILKDIEPASYPVTEGNFLSSPDAEEPVKVIAVEVRYPDYQILNDAEEVSGTLTLDSMSDEGMSGSIDMTLTGEGGEVSVTTLFDVPVVGRLE